MLDSNTGTHLVPPAYTLPPAGFDNRSTRAEVQQWLTEYEAESGPRGTSDMTAEKVPLERCADRTRRRCPATGRHDRPQKLARLARNYARSSANTSRPKAHSSWARS